jgi:hypothetical protein
MSHWLRPGETPHPLLFRQLNSSPCQLLLPSSFTLQTWGRHFFLPTLFTSPSDDGCAARLRNQPSNAFFCSSPRASSSLAQSHQLLSILCYCLHGTLPLTSSYSRASSNIPMPLLIPSFRQGFFFFVPIALKKFTYYVNIQILYVHTVKCTNLYCKSLKKL